MSSLLLQMSPIALVIALILILRRPPVQAALAGVVLVLVLWALGAAGPVSAAISSAIFQDTTILFLSTACVIVPGLAFVILVERGGAPQAIGAWVKELGWTPPAQVIFIVLGLAPLLEAMTGFGVSLIATVPLLMGLFTRQSGMKIALAGMVIMPWGTLGLATVIGALLAHLPAQTLGSHSALISAPVFLCLASLALWQAGIRKMTAWLGLLVVTACSLPCCLASTCGSARKFPVCWPGWPWLALAWASPGRNGKNWCAGRARHGLIWPCWE